MAGSTVITAIVIALQLRSKSARRNQNVQKRLYGIDTITTIITVCRKHLTVPFFSGLRYVRTKDAITLHAPLETTI